MPAKKYENYVWEEAKRQENYSVEQNFRRQESLREKIAVRNQKNSLTVYVAQLVVLVVVAACFALLGIHQESVYFNKTNKVAKVHANVVNLTNTNKKLEIEVDNLKRAERIAAIASDKLGMRVARNNVYINSRK